MKGSFMTAKLFLFLVIGTIAMGIPILIMTKKYEISQWKACIVTAILTVTGTAGTFLMYYVENQRFGGLSFYGAVFLVPVVFLAVTPILRIPYGKAMDFCAVGECIILALMKVHCITGNCCLGRVLWTFSDGMMVRFPSRVAEMTVAIIIFVILFRWAMHRRKQGELYIWYMLLYGTSRFVLNFFREEWVTKESLMPIGNIWSMIATGIGTILLIAIRRKNEKYLYLS